MTSLRPQTLSAPSGPPSRSCASPCSTKVEPRSIRLRPADGAVDVVHARTVVQPDGDAMWWIDEASFGQPEVIRAHLDAVAAWYRQATGTINALTAYLTTLRVVLSTIVGLVSGFAAARLWDWRGWLVAVIVPVVLQPLSHAVIGRVAAEGHESRGHVSRTGPGCRRRPPTASWSGSSAGESQQSSLLIGRGGHRPPEVRTDRWRAAGRRAVRDPAACGSPPPGRAARPGRRLWPGPRCGRGRRRGRTCRRHRPAHGCRHRGG